MSPSPPSTGPLSFLRIGSCCSQAYIEPQIVRTVDRAAIEAGASPWVYTEDDWFVLPGRSAHVEHESGTVRFRPTAVESFELCSTASSKCRRSATIPR